MDQRRPPGSAFLHRYNPQVRGSFHTPSQLVTTLTKIVAGTVSDSPTMEAGAGLSYCARHSFPPSAETSFLLTGKRALGGCDLFESPDRAWLTIRKWREWRGSNP